MNSNTSALAPPSRDICEEWRALGARSAIKEAACTPRSSPGRWINRTRGRASSTSRAKIGRVAGSLVTLLSLECIVVGGGLVEQASIVRPIRGRPRSCWPEELRGSRSREKLGANAGLLGAAIGSRAQAGRLTNLIVLAERVRGRMKTAGQHCRAGVGITSS